MNIKLTKLVDGLECYLTDPGSNPAAPPRAKSPGTLSGLFGLKNVSIFLVRCSLA